MNFQKTEGMLTNFKVAINFHHNGVHPKQGPHTVLPCGQAMRMDKITSYMLPVITLMEN